MTFSDSFQILPGTRTPKSRHCLGVYRLLLLSFGVLIIYWIFLVTICELKNAMDCDRINRIIFDVDVIGGFGGWSLAHIILYYFVGLLFPDCMMIAMVIGIIWECLEQLVGYLLPRDIVNVTKSPGRQYQNEWIHGSISDVLYNFIGFVAGMLTTKYFLNGNPPKVPWLSADSTVSGRD